MVMKQTSKLQLHNDPKNDNKAFHCHFWGPFEMVGAFFIVLFGVLVVVEIAVNEISHWDLYY
jgi:hypothetical protein